MAWLAVATLLTVCCCERAWTEGRLRVETTMAVADCAVRSQEGDTLTWHYTGTLEDGSVFDSSVGKQPYYATIGAGHVIAGVDEAMRGMCVGEKRFMRIPPHMAYGQRGVDGVIPPDATINFDVELLKIDRPANNKEL